MMGYGYAGVQGMSGAGLHAIGGLLFLGFWVCVVVGIVMLISGSHRRLGCSHLGMNAETGAQVPVVTSSRVERDPAENIARERYARGEIDRDEYERIVSALRAVV